MTVTRAVLRAAGVGLFLLASTSPAEAGGYGRARHPLRRSLASPINVRDLGAQGDGVRDDTQAFLKALKLAGSGGGAEAESDCQESTSIFVPAGTYVVSQTLHVTKLRGMQFIGAGVGSTTVVWSDDETGENEGVLFRMESSSDCRFEGFRIVSEAESFEAAFLVLADDTSTCSSVGNVWEQVAVDGGVNGIDRAFRFVVEGEDLPTELMNSNHVLRSVEVRNYLEAGFSLEHQKVRNLEFYSCLFWGEDRGRSGLATNLGVVGGQQNYGGSFRWFGGGGGKNVGADFELGDVTDTIQIQGGHFRGSSRFVHTGGPSGNQWPLVIQSNVWLDDGIGTHETSPWPELEQMRVVNFQFRGPLTMTGNQFGVPPDPVAGPQVAKPLEIIWNPGNNFGQFLFEGNYVATTKENPFTGITASGSSIGIFPTGMRGNLVEAEDFGNGSNVLQVTPTVTKLSGSPTPTVGWLHTNRRLFKSGAGNPITNLLHGQVGQEVVVLGTEGGRSFVASDALRLGGSADLVLGDGDTVTLVMFDPGVWTEIARSGS